MGDIVDEYENFMPVPGNGRAKRARIDREGNLVVSGDIYAYDRTVRPPKRYKVSAPPVTVSVKSYGALGDGVTDDSAAVQLAFDAVPATGGAVYFPPGVYPIGTAINIDNKDNVAVYGDGATIDATALPVTGVNDTSTAVFQFNASYVPAETSLTVSVVEGDLTITVADGSLIQAGDYLIVQSGTSYNDVLGEKWYEGNNKCLWVYARKVVGNVVTISPSADLSIDHTITTVVVTIVRPQNKVHIRDLVFTSSAPGNYGNGVGQYAIYARKINDFIIENCTFEHFSGAAARFFKCTDIKIIACSTIGHLPGIARSDIVEGVNSGYYTFNPFYCRDILIDQLYSLRNRHGTDLLDSTNCLVRNSTVIDAWNGAFRCHQQCSNVSYIGCRAYNCGSGFDNNGFPLSLISDCLVEVLGSCVVDQQNGAGADYGVYATTLIKNSVFKMTGTTPALRALTLGGNYKYLLVENCVVESKGRGIVIYSVVIDAARISNNLVKTGTDASDDGIFLVMTTSPNTLRRNNVSVINNFVENNGRSGIRFEGTNTRASPAENIVIKDNTVDSTVGIGSFSSFGVGFWGKAVSFVGNSTPYDGGVVVPAAHAMEFQPEIQQMRYLDTGYTFFDGGATSDPTAYGGGYTFRRGAFLKRPGVAAGSYLGWVCTASGTTGVLAGVTANTDGTAVITLIGNSSTGVVLGSYITVNGVSTRVEAISEDLVTATLANVVPAAAGTPVAYTNPTFVETCRIFDTADVTGAKAGNVALTNLLTVLAAQGIITDSTT